ncbi:MAG: M24 family metallopeptidase, partial [Actinomycetales bacterium]
VMTYAYALAEAGLEAGMAALQPGVSERDLAAEIEYAMRKAGSEGCGIDTIVGSGPRNTNPILTRAYPRVIGGGELVLFTIAPRYEGYHAAVGRPVMVDGSASGAMLAASECSIEASHAIVAALQVGARGADVAKAGLAVFERAGLLAHNVYSGNHTIGTAEFEPPILTSTSSLLLTEDMVFSVDVPCFFADWGGMRYEDGYRLTEHGPVRMSATPLVPLAE